MRDYEETRTPSFAALARRILIAVTIVGGGGLLVALNDGSSAKEPKRVPPPLHDIAATGGTQTAVLAGGCFWGVQGAFQHVAGVISATAGYAGGSAETATYEMTETKRTGHAEAVEIVFDPKQISYGRLLEIFFTVAHDPTQVDRQGPDIGPQYRSAIFARNEEQAKVASDYIAQLDTADAFSRPIATTIEPGKTFYRAEAYHQDYMRNNPGQPYVLVHELPKIEALRRLFPSLYRAQPVLLAGHAG
jgi:peptide-methionine (S)-S-oxide reductase